MNVDELRQLYTLLDKFNGPRQGRGITHTDLLLRRVRMEYGSELDRLRKAAVGHGELDGKDAA